MALERQLEARALGKNLARRRAKLDLTQEQAAKKIGVTYRAYQRWELGESFPYPRNIQHILRAFEMERSELYVPEASIPEDELRTQLDRIEQKLDDALDHFDASLAVQDADDAVRGKPQRAGRSAPKRASKQKKRKAG